MPNATAPKEIMLINATQPEEIRVALVKNNVLYDLDIDCPSETKKKGNIYNATVTRVEPSLDAVFVEYGGKRQGFLPVKEIADIYFRKIANPKTDEKPALNTLIRVGQDLLVQVEKEERGNKGAALTTFITLAGCYLVLMPNNPESGGISRRIEGDERDELKSTLNALTLPEEMGLIIRTAGVGKSHDELQADLDMLCNQWQAIWHAHTTQLAPCLIHQEGDVIIRSIRDNLRKSIDEILIDDHVSYTKAKQYIEQVKPDFLPHLKLYNSHVPLFNFYQIESQIESAYQREVALPSGGALVIDRTEALVSIDVNSAKATSGSDIETTAVNTNMEAADEIARQLRLRDLGGLVVIDFIDMSSTKNQRDVENRLKEALKADRARIQVGRISRFGLLEMSRQRLRLSLGENEQGVCPRCQGRGTVRNIQSHTLSMIRLIEEEALKEKTAEIQVQLPVEMATFLMNEKRDFILSIEKRHAVSVVIIANPYMHAPQYSITRLKEENVGKNKKTSYDLIQQPELLRLQTADAAVPPSEPIVKAFSTASDTKQRHEPGLIKRALNYLLGAGPTKPASSSTSTLRESSSAVRNPGARPNNPQGNRRRRPAGSGNVHQRTNPNSNPHSTTHQQQGVRKPRNPNQHPSHNPNRTVSVRNPDMNKKPDPLRKKETIKQTQPEE